MRRVKAQITDFQSIEDSTEFDVGDVHIKLLPSQ